MKFFYSLLLLIINFFNYQLHCNNQNNSVSHKNSQLDLYLDFIRYNCDEKIGILPYILEKKTGIYLEIGTGGNPVWEMLNQIPDKYNVSIIASDIDNDILKSLPKRNPDLNRYINSQTGLKLQLQELNAVDMSIFKNNYLDGINVSSVIHEVFSYEKGFEGVKRFFNEAFRTLKKNGVLIYRDPEALKNKKSIVSVKLKNKTIRLFFHIFIYKFLDRTGSYLGTSERKLKIYNPKDISFKIYKKKKSNSKKLNYYQYLKTPSYDIDFSRDYSIKLPLGLYKELSRHYLTYLHQCNPLKFIKHTPNINSNLYNVHYFAHSTKSIFENYLKQSNEQMINGMINNKQKMKIEESIDNNSNVLEFGVPIKFESKSKKEKLISLLKKHNYNPNKYIITFDINKSLLDYRIFGILYDEISNKIFDKNNGLINKEDEVHAKWLKREGEEFYFYYSDDELISKVAKITITKTINENGSFEYLILCPLSEKHNKFVPRLCYTNLLNAALTVKNSLHYPIKIEDGKRVIHFEKMNLKKALNIYKKIVNSNPNRYIKLKKVINFLERNYID